MSPYGKSTGLLLSGLMTTPQELVVTLNQLERPPPQHLSFLTSIATPKKGHRVVLILEAVE